MRHKTVPSVRLYESHFRSHFSSNNFIRFIHLTAQFSMEKRMNAMMCINRDFIQGLQREIDYFKQATEDMEISEKMALTGQQLKKRWRTYESTSAEPQPRSKRPRIDEEKEGILYPPASGKKSTVQRAVGTQRPHYRPIQSFNVLLKPKDLVLIEAASKHDLLDRSTDALQLRTRQQKAQEPRNVSDSSRVWRRANNDDQSCHQDMKNGGNHGTWQHRRQWKHAGVCKKNNEGMTHAWSRLCNKDRGTHLRTKTDWKY